MRRKAIVTLAIGDLYFDMAFACINTARKFLGKECEYVIFYANLKNDKKKDYLNDVHLEDIDALIYRRKKKDELEKMPFLYRTFKSIPFAHKKYLDYDMLFLDADSLVFFDKFDEIFDYVQKKSLLIFGSYRADDYCHIVQNGYKLNLMEQARNLGYENIKNMGINSGFVGRAGDHIGQKFGKLLDELIIKDELVFPPNYYNDELYFMMAFQLAIWGDKDKGKTIGSGIVCTTHGADIIIKNGHHNVYKRLSGEGLIEKPAIVHYVGKTNTSEYRKTMKRNLPFNYKVNNFKYLFFEYFT
jgi:hypothetical protein